MQIQCLVNSPQRMITAHPLIQFPSTSADAGNHNGANDSATPGESSEANKHTSMSSTTPLGFERSLFAT
jgi:hypothetical protein